MTSKIYTAPNTTQVVLGKTLPSLLDEACERYPNSKAFNQCSQSAWIPLSNQDFRTASEHVAFGLLNLELKKGERICLFMHSDVHFAIADMGCLLAKLVNVPIYLTQTADSITFIMKHTEAKALIVSDIKLLCQIAPVLLKAPKLKTVVVAEVAPDFQQSLPPLPEGIRVVSMDEVRREGQAHFSAQAQQQLRADIAPSDLATLVYTSGTTGEPKGVMLTHENLAAVTFAGFTCLQIKPGIQEVSLLFLPLTHILGRALLYAHISYGHCIYFSTPERLGEHLREVQPTLFVTVPRLLEKVHDKILAKGNQLSGLMKKIFYWAVNLTKRYELGQKPSGFYALQLKIADKLVFSKWRAALGGRITFLGTGGAPLRADLANFFSAAGMTLFQGYGLTETSSVINTNQGEFNRAGTVGVPIIGVEMAIADDGEILARAPYITKGYYKNFDATREAIDEEGWFHTGDIGEFTEDGFLKITDRKKSLFKLSNGEYVAPQPLENQLQHSPLLEHAIIVGAEQKFCALLIIPNIENLQEQAKQMELEIPSDDLIKHPKILALYQTVVNDVNKNLPSWAKIKRFKLINTTLTIENDMLTPTLKVRRGKVSEFLATEINSLFA